jgi:hypothetical protein
LAKRLIAMRGGGGVRVSRRARRSARRMPCWPVAARGSDVRGQIPCLRDGTIASA